VELRAKRPGAALLATAALLLALPATAAAQSARLPTTPQDKPPLGYRLTPIRAIAIANEQPKIEAEKHKWKRLQAVAYLANGNQWQVSYFQTGKERAQVIVDDPSGGVSRRGRAIRWRGGWREGTRAPSAAS
jgi:hypothetical protein